jgi:hypothetical protein
VRSDQGKEEEELETWEEWEEDVYMDDDVDDEGLVVHPLTLHPQPEPPHPQHSTTP